MRMKGMDPFSPEGFSLLRLSTDATHSRRWQLRNGCEDDSQHNAYSCGDG